MRQALFKVSLFFFFYSFLLLFIDPIPFFSFFFFTLNSVPYVAFDLPPLPSFFLFCHGSLFAFDLPGPPSRLPSFFFFTFNSIPYIAHRSTHYPRCHLLFLHFYFRLQRFNIAFNLPPVSCFFFFLPFYFHFLSSLLPSFLYHCFYF